MAAKHYLTLRAFSQLLLTFLTLGTSMGAFALTILFNEAVSKHMEANFTGPMTSKYEPCIRNTNPECGNEEWDTCWVAKPWCCPEGYSCRRSPVVGLYCQHGSVPCGNENWCRDYADISGKCRTEVCQQDQLVQKMSAYALVMSSMGVLLDIVDVVAFAACQDSVVFKSTMNIMSSCIKWLAFGTVVGSGAQEFITALYTSRCYDQEGQDMVSSAGEFLIAYILIQVFSAMLSLVLAPCSAYYGGKLIGVPYVK